MVEIRKILYATDLSKNASFAFRYAIYLAKRLDAEVVILHVVEKMSSDALLAMQAYMDEENRKKVLAERVDRAIDRIKKRLEKFCENEFPGDPDCAQKVVSIDVCEGYPAEEILEKSEAFNCDAIVMGGHEKGFSHTFLGSVAKRVLRRSRKPTFVIPLPEKGVGLPIYDD